MFMSLWIELAIAVIVTAVLGLVLDKRLKGLQLAGMTLLVNLLPMVIVASISTRYLPLHHLRPTLTKFDPYTAPYLVNTYLVLEIAIWGSALVGIVGYFANRLPGAVALQESALLATLICLGAAAGPFLTMDVYQSTWYLGAAIFWGVPFVIWVFQRHLAGYTRAFPTILLWYEFCISCWIGYQIGGRLGLLLITFPSQLILWFALAYVARHILPTDAAQGHLAFRCLIAYLLGMHPNYYLLENLESWAEIDPEPRIAGRARQSPGIILARRGTLAVAKTQQHVETFGEGLHFSDPPEVLKASVSLRDQVYTTQVEAKTSDGERFIVHAYISYRFNPRAEALIRLLDEPDEAWHKQVADKMENIARDHVVKWSSERLLATAEDETEEVATPAAGPTPLTEISRVFHTDVEQALRPLGIEVLRGGVSAIELPASAARERIAHWRAVHVDAIDEAAEDVEKRFMSNVRRAQTRFRKRKLEDIAEVLAEEGDDGLDEAAQRSLAQKLIQMLQLTPGDAPLRMNAGSSLLDYYLRIQRRSQEPPADQGQGGEYA